MTLYAEKSLATLLNGATDPDLNPIRVRRINGVVPGLWPHQVSLGTGFVLVGEDGTLTFDDGGSTAGHPGANTSATAGTFTYRLWDGEAESPAYTCTVTLNGIGDVSLPASTFLFLGEASDPANFVLDGNGRISQWNDLSGNGNHAVQPSAGLRPLRDQDNNLSWSALQAGDEHLILTGLPSDTPFHLAIGFASDDGIGTVLRSTSVNRPTAVQWYYPGASAPPQSDTGQASFTSLHVGATDLTNANTRSDLGLAMINETILSLRDLTLNQSTGYIWADAQLFHYAMASQFNVDGRVYGVIAFTDWAERATAEAYLAQLVGANVVPSDLGETLEFNVGAPQ